MLVGDFDLSKWFYLKASDSSVIRVMLFVLLVWSGYLKFSDLSLDDTDRKTPILNKLIYHLHTILLHKQISFFSATRHALF